MSAPTVLMHLSEVIDVKNAATWSGRSEKTIRRWVRDHGIGRQAGRSAPLEISLPALAMVLHGDFEALELLRSGCRATPAITRYFDHLGLEAQPVMGSTTA